MWYFGRRQKKPNMRHLGEILLQRGTKANTFQEQHIRINTFRMINPLKPEKLVNALTLVSKSEMNNVLITAQTDSCPLHPCSHINLVGCL